MTKELTVTITDGTNQMKVVVQGDVRTLGEVFGQSLEKAGIQSFQVISNFNE